MNFLSHTEKKGKTIKFNIITKKSKSYFFDSSQIYFTSSINKSASFILDSFFHGMKKRIQGLITSTITYNHTFNKVTIELFYYIPEHSNHKYFIMSARDISFITETLSSIYQKEVSLVFTRVHYPYLNSSIFSQYLAHNASSNTFVHYQDSILTYPSLNITKLPSHVTGIKIELSGRLITEAVVPRITKKAYLLGSFSGSSIVDYAKYTDKNELGSFTIKV